jgi:hypothetical protein
VNAPTKLDIATYSSSPAIHYTATTAGGITYYVVVVEREAYALVQPEGCQGWAQVCIGNLGLRDEDEDDVVIAAVIEDAFVL